MSDCIRILLLKFAIPAVLVHSSTGACASSVLRAPRFLHSCKWLPRGNDVGSEDGVRIYLRLGSAAAPELCGKGFRGSEKIAGLWNSRVSALAAPLEMSRGDLKILHHKS